MNRIETTEALYRAFRAKDYGRFAELCTPDLEWRQNPGFPAGGVHHGPDEVVRNVFKAFSQDWASFGFEIQEMKDAGDAVLVTGVYRARTPGSDEEIVCEACHLYTFRDGRICRFQQYADTHVLWEALRGHPARAGR